MKQVIVKDKEETYSTYKNWIVRYFPEELKNFKYGKVPLENRIYNVLGQAPHEDTYFGTLYLIQDIYTKQVYIIGEKGIKFVNKLPFTKEQIDELIFNKESETKMKDKLKVKVWNYKNVVLFEVLEQDESLRKKGEIFEASNGWKIKSVFRPQAPTDDGTIYIRGTIAEYDYKVTSVILDSINEAKQVVKKIKQVVKEFNASFNQILDKEEKEYLSAVIKPFRNRVQYIQKKTHPVDIKEYISIELNDDDIPLPYFKEDTMYKGMETYKRYTLEELGL